MIISFVPIPEEMNPRKFCSKSSEIAGQVVFHWNFISSTACSQDAVGICDLQGPGGVALPLLLQPGFFLLVGGEQIWLELNRDEATSPLCPSNLSVNQLASSIERWGAAIGTLLQLSKAASGHLRGEAGGCVELLLKAFGPSQG